ncbi:MAG: hypothetical protein K2H43_05945, partial [Clostridia bacterium]|nr:hypothetical protein [Clostridia bacterium]
EALSVKIDYAQNGIAVSGELTVNLDDYTVAGTVTLGYNGISKSADVVFAGGELYLAIDGLKLKASVQTLMELLGEVLEKDSLSIDTQELLKKALSLDFGALIELSESENKLEVLVRGSELLSALGIDFTLGDVSVGVESGKLTLVALGIVAEVQAGVKYTVGNLNEYADIAPVVPYIGMLKTLLTSDVLQAHIDYSAENFTVSGTVNLAFRDKIRASGTLTVTVGEESLNIAFGYQDDTVYFDFAGIKLKGNVSEIAELVKGALPGAGTEIGMDLQSLIDTLFSAETLANIAVAENDGTLQILIKGTELLRMFGIHFALGDVELSVFENGISASVLGVNAAIKQGESFAVDQEGYTEILPYVQQLIEIFKGEALSVKIDYAQGDVRVSGDLTIDFRPFSIFGTVEVAYGEFVKTAAVLYRDGEIY